MCLKALYPEFESIDLPLQVVVLSQHARGVHLRVMSRPSLLSDDPFQLGRADPFHLGLALGKVGFPLPVRCLLSEG